MNPRHSLLFYESTRRQGIVSLFAILMILFTAGIVEWFSPFLGERVWWLAAVIALNLILLAYYWWGLAQVMVIVTPQHLLVRGLVWQFIVPYSDIEAVTFASMASHHPPEQLSPAQLGRITPFYEHPTLFIELKTWPVHWFLRQACFPRTFFGTQATGFFLPVAEAETLHQQIEPLLEEAPAVSPTPAEVEPPLFTPAEKETAHPQAPLVLVVDDSVAQITQIQQMLYRHFRVSQALDGVDALQKARLWRPQAIILDIHIPTLNVITFIQAIRRHKRVASVPILLIADAHEKERCVEALQVGATDFLTRPYSPAELLFRLQTWIYTTEQEKKLTKQVEALQNRTLDQMAELIRRGELINFLPERVAQNIMSGQISRKGEPFRRQRITVLFVDIVGFTPLTDQLDPNMLADLLNDYLREMTAVAIKHNGTVDKFIGDAVMVIFGAPEPKEESEQVWEATQTALAMLEAIEQLNLMWRSRLPRALQVRIGFNTGYCTVGVFGNEMLQSYTVIGPPVNVASRLQTVVTPNGVVCSAESWQWVKEKVTYREMGALSLKGVAHLVEAYEILSLRSV